MQYIVSFKYFKRYLKMLLIHKSLQMWHIYICKIFCYCLLQYAIQTIFFLNFLVLTRGQYIVATMLQFVHTSLQFVLWWVALLNSSYSKVAMQITTMQMQRWVELLHCIQLQNITVSNWFLLENVMNCKLQKVLLATQLTAGHRHYSQSMNRP